MLVICLDECDILIENGLIVDGTGSPVFKGSVAIQGDRIVEVGKVKCDAKVVIDASGLVVAPGFIDVHTHADKTLPLFPKAENYVMQGITTTIGGNCGNVAAPILDWWPPNMFWDQDILFELKPYKYYIEGLLPADEVKKKVKEIYGVDITWGLFKDFIKWLEENGISVNHVPLAGHNTIRAQVMGPDWNREPTPKELEEMKWHVREAMEAGAFGLSTGLDYVPGVFSKTEEIIELVKVVKEFNGIYATHWRRTGLRRERAIPIIDKIRGIHEAIRICRETGVVTEISHLMSGYTIYPEPPIELALAAVRETIKVIDEARKEGLKIYYDIIPNVTGGTLTSVYLAALLTPWAREIGSLEGLGRALKMKDFREELKSLILAGKWWALNPRVNPYWDNKIEIVSHANQEYVGKTIKEIAEIKDVDSIEALFDILSEDPKAKYKNKGYRTDEEIAEFIKYPYCMIGLDTYTFDTKWSMKLPPYYVPHPNTYGGMPRYIRKYVREMKVLPLEEAIRRITSLPAKVFKIKNRGIIKVGAYADIVIFDYKTISDVEDPIDPRRYPKGIHYVIVNGVIVVEKGKHTGTKPGKVLKLNEQ